MGLIFSLGCFYSTVDVDYDGFLSFVRLNG